MYLNFCTTLLSPQQIQHVENDWRGENASYHEFCIIMVPDHNKSSNLPEPVQHVPVQGSVRVLVELDQTELQHHYSLS